MVAFILLSILFLSAAIFHSYFFTNPKLKPWLLSLLPKSLFPPNPPENRAPVTATTTAIAQNKENKISSSTTTTDELEMVFATFDRDGDGFLTVKELEDSLRKLGLAGGGDTAAATVARLDANGDGLLDLEEFRQLYDSIGSDGGGGNWVKVGREGEEEERELREAFEVFDGNGDGLITVEELGLVLTSLGLTTAATAASCRDMIKKVDLDGDGMVCFEEFKRMMRMSNNNNNHEEEEEEEEKKKKLFFSE